MKKLFIIILLLLSVKLMLGQGCSDAGFCTMESFQSNPLDTNYHQHKNTFKLGQSLGMAAKSITAYASYFDYGRSLGETFKINLKITSLLQSGKGLTTFGISDAFVNGTMKLTDNLNLTTGIKIPFNKADKTYNSQVLPMDFQSSLGTLDAILGVSFSFKGYKFSTAIQQPITQNKNSFSPELYPENSVFREFHNTRNFYRYADVLISISKPLKLNSHLIFTPNILPIYHIQNDTYTNLQNEEVAITGSKGLTLNINLYFDYKINSRNNLQINAGAPIIARESRPEGLTRSAIVNLEYSIQF